ncbi:hypothetical protein LI328DRAFT_71320 [Trichoderma asperelloides]|nr:hypothetical protein LI328DRAFT_71320 [Trichoderma asperelloides]
MGTGPPSLLGFVNSISAAAACSQSWVLVYSLIVVGISITVSCFTYPCCMQSMCISPATVAMGSMTPCSGHLPAILWIRSKEPAYELRLATGGIQGSGERVQDAIQAFSPHTVLAPISYRCTNQPL